MTYIYVCVALQFLASAFIHNTHLVIDLHIYA